MRITSIMLNPIQRNSSLDCIKWLAIVTMVIDHLRLITSLADFNNLLVTIGRFAFPLFAFVLAYNFHRILIQKKYTALKSYLINLSIFSIISEIPYRLLEQNPTTINVMPTLLLGLVFMIIVESKTKYKVLVIGFFSISLIFLGHWLMYGFLGVLLPVSCLIALKYRNNLIIALPMLIAALSNAQYLISVMKLMPSLFYSIVICASIAILFAFIFIKYKKRFKVSPVGHWGYWFYPVHLAIFHIINKIV